MIIQQPKQTCGPYTEKKKKKTKTNNESPGVPYTYGGLKHNFLFQLKNLKINNSLCFELL